MRGVSFKDIPEYLRGNNNGLQESQSDDAIIAPEEFWKISDSVYRLKFIIPNAHIWDITSPDLYEIEIFALESGKCFDEYKSRFGLRTIKYTTDNGFFLNGRHVKINGVCEHHDLGLFGAAFNKDAMRRKFVTLKQMGVNAVRTSHNMPASELLELADEMGILIDAEGFDMWRRSKTEFDYARFFEENYEKDIKNWVRRDRNHPSVIMWSIGNEIYDCHADANAPELTLDMKLNVEKYDYAYNAIVTHGSNFMAWEGARRCTQILKLAGYNYGERLYDKQHKDHPDWMIYGSETGSTVQSRGIYHFPLSVSILADDDEQCSSLGNCSTSWGAPNTEYVITMDRDREFSAGQFIWTGFDYIGEPTPYHTKNSYFGQIDTAGFPKDSFYILKGTWTDPETAPFVHIFPYWDFNDGQIIDVRTATNCDKIELFFNDRLIGSADIDHKTGYELVPTFRIPYEKGKIKAIAYLNGIKKAETEQTSFGDPVALSIKENYRGEKIVFLEINAKDKDGITVENAASRIYINVKNGVLLGLDNGDSTDEEDYKCNSRRLFSGKLIAAVATQGNNDKITVIAESEGLEEAKIILKDIGKEYGSKENIEIAGNAFSVRMEEKYSKEIPVRNIILKTDGSNEFNPEKREMTIRAEILPANATYNDIKWVAVNEKAVPTNIVKVEPFNDENGHFCRLTALGDGEFRLRALCYNGGRVAKVISSLEFKISGIGHAFIDPYNFVYGSLYTDHKGEIGNGNEKGISTPRGEESYFGFENVDFGDIGSDEITIPIFTLNDADYHVGIWEGKPNEPGSILLCDGKYCKKSIWNVYQPETYKLSKRLKGITNLYFTADDKYHFKGFEFKKTQKAFEQLYMDQRSRIYGDTFTIDKEAILGIGNNVTIEFDDMDFGVRPAKQIVICGKSVLENNSIHLKFEGTQGISTQLLEFSGSDEYVERTFDIQGACGVNKVGFVFLPGCDFDFKYFRFV